MVRALVEGNPVEGSVVRSELASSAMGSIGVTNPHFQASRLPASPLAAQTASWNQRVRDWAFTCLPFRQVEASDDPWDLRPTPTNTGLIFTSSSAFHAEASLPWASADLGKPATFDAGDQHYLLFVGLAQKDKLTRSIGLARESASGRTVCNNTSDSERR
jgi:hypothetical protein